MCIHCSCLQAHQKTALDPITDGFWDSNSGPLEEQSVLLTPEPSLVICEGSSERINWQEKGHLQREASVLGLETQLEYKGTRGSKQGSGIALFSAVSLTVTHSCHHGILLNNWLRDMQPSDTDWPLRNHKTKQTIPLRSCFCWLLVYIKDKFNLLQCLSLRTICHLIGFFRNCSYEIWKDVWGMDHLEKDCQ